MLFGIDTKERDKAGFLADKNRYLPWSGAPMSGELQVEFQGEDITIRRFPAKTNPFGGFEAVYTASGDPVPFLTASNVGETLTGAGKEVFLRSGFVGQSGAEVTQNGELEARISALATSGQEDVSYTATARTLKDWRNRRRSNRANGLIPELEDQLAGTEQTLRDMARLAQQRDEARGSLDALRQEQQELTGDLETWNRLERHELNQRYAQALNQWELAKAAIPGAEDHPVFGHMTGDEAWAHAQKKQAEREEILAENRRRKQAQTQAEQTFQSKRTQGLVLALLAVCVVFLGAIWLFSGVSPVKVGIFVLALVLVALGAALALRALKQAREDLNSFNFIEVPDDTDDLLRQASDYRAALMKREQALALEESARRRVEDLKAQGAQTAQTLELLTPPPRSKAETASKLAQVSSEITRLERELSRAEGALAQMGDPEGFEAQRGELETALQQRIAEYDAIDLAMEALDEANRQLRARFSPALNRAASDIFSKLTGGRWTNLELSRDFSANISQGGVMPKSALYLSAGTAEQLYLAVRLAMCQLTLPDCPILLDDALANFDDTRTEKALNYLDQLGSQRQILLFSCHQREAAWGNAHGTTVLSL
jgi:hypothetical protein